MRQSFVFLLFLLGAAGSIEIALAQSPGTFSATGSMTTPRTQHTATLLTNGKVLIAGGNSQTGPLATAELYDPDTGKFVPTGDMITPRAEHTASLLPDGKVLIVGGTSSLPSGRGLLNTAEVYDPSTGKFAPAGNTIHDHLCPQANLLADGRVLLSGGEALGDDPVPDAELFDPIASSFADAGPYSTDTSGFNTCQGAASTLLANGKVLLVWEEGTAEIYEPAAGAFTPTGKPLKYYDEGLPTATLLMNGQVLVAGGTGLGDLSPKGAALYDPHTGAFVATGDMITGHVGQTATLLPDGTVLLAGNLMLFTETVSAELYDPAAGAFTATGNLITARGMGQTATLLNNGQVLVAGGSYAGNISMAEIYQPVLSVPAAQLFSLSGDGRGQGAILHAGTARVVTASDPAVVGEALELYGAGLADGAVIPPQVSIGGRLAEVLFFGKAPGYSGLNQINVRVPSGVTPGSAVAVRLNYLARPSNEVTIGVQ